ncbi:hypothetical protein B4N89_45010 [Embleya scabrispora]|uniref:Uncharacterized protein n=1 Tax=Embleya scabrispora TaxID=159449 RepID=A0A1T3NIM7_9ACTN|nr:hypothetical protein [Embleya scabrispora]OPC76653.1 hypothetical protein B4N89_45010 [Embleya scabrispora]
MGAGSRIQQQFHVIVPSASGHTALPFDGEHRPNAAVHGAAAQDVLDELEEEHERALMQGALPLDPEETSSFASDVAAFDRAYLDGTTGPIDYLAVDATGGLAARDTGRPFGVRIEFCADDNRVLMNIARELYDAGVARDPHLHGFDGAREFGFSDRPDDWRLEGYGVATGTLVSPMMYDEPVTWRNLARVCEIVVALGGWRGPPWARRWILDCPNMTISLGITIVYFVRTFLARTCFFAWLRIPMQIVTGAFGTACRTLSPASTIRACPPIGTANGNMRCVCAAFEGSSVPTRSFG